MRFEWDLAKDKSNRKKHDLSFAETTELFKTGADYLEIYDEEHSDDEDRFIAWRPGKSASASRNSKGKDMSDEIRELTDRDFARAMPRKQRERISFADSLRAVMMSSRIDASSD